MIKLNKPVEYVSKETEKKIYQTSDDKFFQRKNDAVREQLDIDILDWLYENNKLPYDTGVKSLLKFVKANQKDLTEILGLLNDVEENND